ncbi:hypothetical protein BJF79_17840 [Actinomadura sp. CNU-125]|uniref:DUF397 domain-containing protein n=1 Tax=Actinomadura sp. CNU-125 TaxID=1904961 RepID=UPI00095C5670|nr:DUF397 domain-containing protein [Actinomadura sp. CNU-125]OLT17415.1 hypothetical protein BJF79_17840 [Actinomadura sp. CNU-125]
MNVQWRKSNHSSGVSDEHCVELGRLVEGVGVRDSKDPSAGHLSLTTSEFAGLVDEIKRLPKE